MDAADLVSKYPRLYHMTDVGNWTLIRRHGLRSTTALLDLFEAHDDLRHRLESRRRPAPVRLFHPDHGSVLIRDQIPLQEEKLARCLIDMSVAEWLRLLNRKVFFWVSEHRVTRLLQARAYREREHEVVTLDTASLVAANNDAIALTPINSGATIFDARPRGAGTFMSIAEYPFEVFRRSRGPRDAVVELAVDYAVLDVVVHTISVEVRQQASVLECIWPMLRGS
jgi:hypothetical protein